MSRLYGWLRSWLGYSEVSRSMRSLEAKIDRLEKERTKSERLLSIRQVELERLHRNMELEFSRGMDAVRKAEEVHKKLSEALESANEALKTANEIVIPGLVQANDTFRSAWDAQSAMQVMRAVAAGSSKEME